MRVHRNAKLLPAQRELLVDRVRVLGWRLTQAAEAAGVSRQTAYKWLHRFEQGGKDALRDRSCRPRRIPRRTPTATLQRIERLRRRRKAGWEISLETGIPVSTVSRHLKDLGLGRIWRLLSTDVIPRP